MSIHTQSLMVSECQPPLADFITKAVAHILQPAEELLAPSFHHTAQACGDKS